MSEHRLSEIVIERPRGGWRCSSRKAIKTDLNRLTQEAIEDGLLSPYLIKPLHKTKYLSDHLSPLRRYLRSKVGQPWNLVYSDLSCRLDKNTVIGKHVIDHLWDFVERHAEINNNIPYHKPGANGSRGGKIGGYHDAFYVHPVTGILCVVERSLGQKSSQKVDQSMIQINAYQRYYQLNNLWFRIGFQDVYPEHLCYDVLLKTDLTPEIARKTYGQPIYAATKHQCSKLELKKLRSKPSDQH